MKKQTLQRQFNIWTVLLVVVPSLMIMAIYTVTQIKSAKRQNLEVVSQRVHSQEQMIDHWIKERAKDVRLLSQSEAFRSLDEQQMQHAVHLALRVNTEFDALSYVGQDGIIRISTYGENLPQPSVYDRPYFQAALAGKEYISDVLIGRNSGLPIIAFTAPLVDHAGNFQGMIFGSVKLTSLETYLRDNWIGETGEIFLVNREGTMLTEPRYVDVLIKNGLVQGTARMNFKITEDAFRNIQLGETGTATWIDYLGNKVLGAYRVMPERGWTIIGKIKEEEVLAPIYHQLQMMTGGVILLLLMILPLAARLSNRIKRPIEWLIEQSNLVAAEEYARVGQNKCPDRISHELSNLCETFIQMSRKIENTVGLLKDKEAKLENKVLEIQDINATLEEEIMERQTAEEALRNSRDALLVSETQLKHVAAELTEANKELKNFANIIAHDFRAPMVNLKGFSQELDQSLDSLQQIINDEKSRLPEKVRNKIDELLDGDVPEALTFIHSSVDRLDRMVVTLLELARMGRREMIYNKVNMAKLVDTVLHSFHHQIEKKDIHIELAPMPHIETDYLAMEQVIGNLIDNAIKYLVPDRPGEISITCTDNDYEYILSIQDNGRGITAIDRERIFEIFRRGGTQDVPGEGMGLAYVRTLIRQLGGRVWCESEPGVGTTMSFTYPKRPA